MAGAQRLVHQRALMSAIGSGVLSMQLRGGSDGCRARRLARASVVLGLVTLGIAASGWGSSFDLPNWDLGAFDGSAWVVLAIFYILLLAVPFVPAIEVGLAIMLLFGTQGVLVVYLCTQIALALGFACGRLLPASLVAARLERLRTQGAAARRQWHQRAQGHPCLALAAALNIPGNAAVGGAGGIALLAGASGLFSFSRYFLTVALATSPIPLALLLSGAV